MNTKEKEINRFSLFTAIYTIIVVSFASFIAESEYLDPYLPVIVICAMVDSYLLLLLIYAPPLSSWCSMARVLSIPFGGFSLLFVVGVIIRFFEKMTRNSTIDMIALIVGVIGVCIIFYFTHRYYKKLSLLV